MIIYQRFPFRSTPILHLLFAMKSINNAVILFSIDESNRQSS